MRVRKILITGGLGYIGSHTVVALSREKLKVVIVDNMSNSKKSVLIRLQQLIGREIPFYEVDIRDEMALSTVFEEHKFDGVIHFAGFKAVAESVAHPLLYYDNNVCGSLELFKVMAAYGVFKIVFSSSAAVYGDSALVPIREDSPLKPTSPYGLSKMFIEKVLCDLTASDDCWRVALLRYFNPVGAHESGMIGEDPKVNSQSLMCHIVRVATGQYEFLPIWGNDYDTCDGTGVRDFVHVQDLAEGHLAALNALEHSEKIISLNLGTGRGYSVLEMVNAFEKACGKTIPYKIFPRRPGDIVQSYVDPFLALAKLGWFAKRDIQEMCQDALRWHQYSAQSLAIG